MDSDKKKVERPKGKREVKCQDLLEEIQGRKGHGNKNHQPGESEISKQRRIAHDKLKTSMQPMKLRVDQNFSPESSEDLSDGEVNFGEEIAEAKTSRKPVLIKKAEIGKLEEETVTCTQIFHEQTSEEVNLQEELLEEELPEDESMEEEDMVDRKESPEVKQFGEESVKGEDSAEENTDEEDKNGTPDEKGTPKGNAPLDLDVVEVTDSEDAALAKLIRKMKLEEEANRVIPKPITCPEKLAQLKKKNEVELLRNSVFESEIERKRRIAHEKLKSSSESMYFRSTRDFELKDFVRQPSSSDEEGTVEIVYPKGFIPATESCEIQCGLISKSDDDEATAEEGDSESVEILPTGLTKSLVDQLLETSSEGSDDDNIQLCQKETLLWLPSLSSSKEMLGSTSTKITMSSHKEPIKSHSSFTSKTTVLSSKEQLASPRAMIVASLTKSDLSVATTASRVTASSTSTEDSTRSKNSYRNKQSFASDPETSDLTK